MICTYHAKHFLTSNFNILNRRLLSLKIAYNKTKNIQENNTTKLNNDNKTQSNETNNKAYCLQMVKKYDYENFLASLMIKNAELRRTSFALRAFNVELSQVRDLTKSDSIAQIRFQFWVDIIDRAYNNNGNDDATDSENTISNSRFMNFPVAAELEKVLSGSNLSKHWLRKLIAIRREAIYLSDFPFQTLEELEKYCDASVTSLYYLLNEKVIELSGHNDAGYRISLDHIASHLGKAQGLTNILRGIRHNSTYRRCYIPNDILLKNKCSHEDFLRGIHSESVCNAVFEVASQANGHLDHSIQLLNELKGRGSNREDKLVFLPYISVKSYLDLLLKCNFDVFDSKLYHKNGFLPFKFWWKSRFSK